MKRTGIISFSFLVYYKKDNTLNFDFNQLYLQKGIWLHSF